MRGRRFLRSTVRRSTLVQVKLVKAFALCALAGALTLAAGADILPAHAQGAKTKAAPSVESSSKPSANKPSANKLSSNKLSSKPSSKPSAKLPAGGKLPVSPPLPPPRPKSMGEASSPADKAKSDRAGGDERPATKSAQGKSDGATQDKSPEPSREVAEREDEDKDACYALLKKRGAVFSPAPETGDGDACKVENPVTLSGVQLEDGRSVSLDSPIVVRCALAAELALWVGEDLAPIMQRHGLQLSELAGVGGYACRNRNRQTATRISEHASGNAFDVHRLKAAGGAVVEIMKDRDDARRPLRQEIRDSACERFPTVLGSGADAFHESHLHVDLRKRGGGFRLCNWDVQ